MDGGKIIEILINWFPMILLIGVWVFFLRRMNGTGGFQTKFQATYLERMKEQTAVLERIASALEAKN